MQVKFSQKKSLGILISLKRVNPQIFASRYLSILKLIVLFFLIAKFVVPTS